MGVAENTLNKVYPGATKWDKYNAEAIKKAEDLIAAGIVRRYVSKSYVAGKMNMLYLITDDDKMLSGSEQVSINREFSQLKRECGISVDDIIFDSQMGEYFVIESRFESLERSVSSWVDTV